MKNIIKPIIFFALVVLIACNKDKFTSKPQVKIKSITPSAVAKKNIIEVKGSFTDDEGDLDSAFIVYRWYNGANIVKSDTFDYDLQTLGLPASTRQGDFTIRFQFNSSEPYTPDILTLPGGNNFIRDTTATIGLFVGDTTGQKSDLAESEKVRLLF